MKQPKFKVGDYLYSRPWKCRFEVDTIRISKNGVFYAAETTDYVKEEDVEVYQEPQRKKLYAMADRYGFIYFQKEGLTLNSAYTPCPEYDINYPEVKND